MSSNSAANRIFRFLKTHNLYRRNMAFHDITVEQEMERIIQREVDTVIRRNERKRNERQIT